MTVKVIKGRHGHIIPKGTEKLIAERLEVAGLPNDQLWIVRLGAQVKGRNSMPPFKVQKLTSMNTIEVKIKPGDNSTVCLCYIVPSTGLKPKNVFEALKRSQFGPVAVKNVSDSGDGDAVLLHEPRVTVAPPQVSSDTGLATSLSHGDVGEISKSIKGNYAGFLKDEDNLQLILLSIREAIGNGSELPIIKVHEIFVENLGGEVSRSITGQLTRSLVDKGFLMAKRNNRLLVAVSLTETGQSFVGDLGTQIAKPPSLPQPKVFLEEKVLKDRDAPQSGVAVEEIKKQILLIDERIPALNTEIETLTIRKKKLQDALDILEELE
jgi:hypothetical protein